jgi:subtilisin-like proprotein convertase family protein
MKRKYVVPFTLSLALLLTLVVIPSGLARRAGSSAIVPEAKKTTPDTGKSPAAVAPLSLPAPRLAQASAPVAAQAVGFGVTPPIRDLPAPEQVKPDPEDEENRVLKSNPNKIIRTEVEGPVAASPDQALQDAPPIPAIPVTSTSFEGISIFDTIGVGQGFLPPDTVGDVGPNHYVQAVNSTFRVWNKSGTPLTPVRTLGSLWASIPGPCANTNDGDPIVLYDSFADRWMISQFCTVANPNNHQLIAVSQTSDPTGAYFVYDFVMPNNKFNDYPKFGVWPDGYYMTDNQFNQAGTAFLGAGVFAFDRAKMLAGDPTASYVYFDVENGNPNIGGMLPADADGLIPPPPGAPCPFAYFTATEFGDPADAIRVFDFHVDFATPANSTFTERAGSPVPVAAFDPRTPAGRDNIEQPPPANNATAALDAIADRLMNRLQYRNYGTHQSLVANHTVNVGTGTTLALHQAAVRYYELRSTGGAFGVHEQATFAPDATNRWMGSAAMDHEGNLAVGYSVSSTTVFPGIRYAGRLASDPPGGLFQGEGILQNGGFVQTHTSSRWGDYSSTNVDPSDDCTFWHTNEYYLDDQPNITAEWHTRVASFKVNPTCQAPAQGRIQVNATFCDNPLQPVTGALVSVNGSLYGATGLTGQNTSTHAPGGYSVTVNAPGFFPVTVNNVNVTNGNTTQVNVCLTGMPSVVSGGTTLTAESCQPADNAISPGETVTVDFGLKNNGTASTSNLVATLQPTGGITNPSGPQNYGVVVPAGPTVARPFTFTVDAGAACGSTITATLNLQDGSTNLGTVTFNFTLGALGPAASLVRGSGNIAVPIPDNATVDIPINVPETGSIVDVNVRVRLNHTFNGDLDLSLVHPDGTVVLLSNNRGGSGDNFGVGANDCSGTSTGFDDQAAATIASGTAPFVGSFRPDAPLSALNGKSSSGTWKLRVADTAAQDVGTVGCVQLEINRQRFICCGVAGTPVIESAPPTTLTAESCTPPNLSIDPEETVTVEFPVRNVGDGATTNLVATLQNSGGVVPVTTSQSYGVVDPLAPGPTSKPFTFVAQGSCGQMITATLQLQDGATNLGTISYTFRLGTTATGTHTFANAAPIAVPGVGTSGPSNPSPSVINVAGVSGTVKRVSVRLKNVSHTFPDDMDVLLVSPTGQKFIVMSDSGGTVDLVNNTITLDDTAVGALPDSTAIGTGTFRPTNFGTGDTFSAPAPPAPYQSPAPAGAATSASVFGGQNPNGNWQLFIQDDVSGDTGSVAGGWELIITTEDPVCCNSACTIDVPENIVQSNDAGECGAVVSYPAATVEGSCGVLSYSHASGSFFPVGTTVVTVTATRADNTTTTATFNVTVVDAESPVISPVTASPNSLWPPNHKMKDVAVTYNAADNCAGAVNCVISSVTSNEPANGTGDGDTAPDWQIISPALVRLRAERAGGGTGRIYTITVQCTDAHGNSSFRTTTVSVPHNQ